MDDWLGKLEPYVDSLRQRLVQTAGPRVARQPTEQANARNGWEGPSPCSAISVSLAYFSAGVPP